MRVTIVACLLVLGGIPGALAQPGAPNDNPKVLEKIIAEAVQKNQPIPDTGAAVAVMKDRKLFYVGGFGQRDRTTRTLVDADTIFALGSATKSFTSMALAILAERKVLVLDRPITQYIQEFGVADSEALNKMTLEDILSHRTGVPRHDTLWYFPPFGRAQLVHRLRYLDPYTRPGTGFRHNFSYNNLMYTAAGQILEALTGSQWETFVRSNILDKLQMPNASFTLADLLGASNRARGYLGAEEMAPRDFTNIGPAGAMNASARELANWILLHLNCGTATNGSKIAEPATLERMYERYIEADPAHGIGYGLGWFISRVDGKRFVYHGGNGEGYTAYMSFMPDDGLGVIVLTNQHAAQFPPLVARAVYEYLLPGSSSRFQFMTEIQPLLLMDLVVMASEYELRKLPTPAKLQFTGNGVDYVGMFSHPGYGDLSVSRRNDDLAITFYQKKWDLQRVTTDLYFFSMTAFGTDYPVVPVVFNRTPTGQVDKVTIPFELTVKPIQFIKR